MYFNFKTILFLNSTFQKLEQQLDTEKNRHREIEKMNKLANIENEHYIINLKMEYEEKIKGLLPSEIRKVSVSAFYMQFFLRI